MMKTDSFVCSDESLHLILTHLPGHTLKMHSVALELYQ